MLSFHYVLNCHEQVRTINPHSNTTVGPQVATEGGSSVLVIVPVTPGSAAYKAYAFAGDPDLKVGEVICLMGITNMGDRRMADHRVVAFFYPDGRLEGKLPAQKRLPLWVAK